MQAEHSELEIAGATAAASGDLAAFRSQTGAEFPILTGVSAATLKAYEVTGMPTIRILGADGKVVGKDEAALEKALAH